MAAQQNNITRPCQLKGSLFTLTVLHLYTDDLQKIQRELSATVERAPQFFQQAPVVIDVHLLGSSSVDFVSLVKLLKQLGLSPVGVRGLNDTLTPHALEANLALLPNAPNTLREEPQLVAPATTSMPSKNLIIHQPIRSGQQVYAKEGDLIVIGAVSHGAELLALGNIHVYGALRGRALAGIHGDKQARIFCQTLEAEMLSIAGLYQLSDDFLAHQHQHHIQVYLESERLVVDSYMK
jgi:septum site-determining protein MinC